MWFNPDDPTTWPLRIPVIAHDVGRSHDRSTAVVGGDCPLNLGRPLLGVKQFLELPLGLYGSALAATLAIVDENYSRDCLIVADLSNDPTYAEVLFDLFGRRLIGVHVGRSGDGTSVEHRRTRNGSVPVYRVGRTFLLDSLLAQFRNDQIRFVDNEESRRAFTQLEGLEPELHESGLIYKCPPGHHDDLAMSLAMLAWAARHLHFDAWTRPIFDAHRPRRQVQSSTSAWAAFT